MRRSTAVTVAIASKRSGRGTDVLDQLFFRRLSNGKVQEPEELLQGGLADPADVQLLLHRQQGTSPSTRAGGCRSGNPQVDPGLLTKGTGKYEWRGFLKPMQHPHGIDNKRGYMTNWNNGAARGFGAADDEWGRNGSVGRIDLLNFNLERLARQRQVVAGRDHAAMNPAATQDMRAIAWSRSYEAAAAAPSPRHAGGQQMLEPDGRLARDTAATGSTSTATA